MNGCKSVFPGSGRFAELNRSPNKIIWERSNKTTKYNSCCYVALQMQQLETQVLEAERNTYEANQQVSVLL